MIIEEHFELDGEKLVKLGIGYDDLVETIANMRDLKAILSNKLKYAKQWQDAKDLEKDFDVAIQAMTMIAVIIDPEVGKNERKDKS